MGFQPQGESSAFRWTDSLPDPNPALQGARRSNIAIARQAKQVTRNMGFEYSRALLRTNLRRSQLEVTDTVQVRACALQSCLVKEAREVWLRGWCQSLDIGTYSCKSTSERQRRGTNWRSRRDLEAGASFSSAATRSPRFTQTDSAE